MIEKNKLIVDAEVKYRCKFTDEILTSDEIVFIVELYQGIFVALAFNVEEYEISHFCSGSIMIRTKPFLYRQPPRAWKHGRFCDDDFITSNFMQLKNKLKNFNITKRKFIEIENKREKLNDPRPIYEKLGIPFSQECKYWNRYHPSFSIPIAQYTGVVKIFN